MCQDLRHVVSNHTSSPFTCAFAFYKSSPISNKHHFKNITTHSSFIVNPELQPQNDEFILPKPESLNSKLLRVWDLGFRVCDFSSVSRLVGIFGLGLGRLGYIGFEGCGIWVFGLPGLAISGVKLAFWSYL